MSGGASLSTAAEDDELTAEITAVSVQDRIDETLIVLKAELMEKLNKEVKSLDEDSWMFEGPRSCIHLISGPGVRKSRHGELRPHGNDVYR